MFNRTDQKAAALKEQILHDVYEQNLVIAGRKVPPHPHTTTPPSEPPAEKQQAQRLHWPFWLFSMAMVSSLGLAFWKVNPSTNIETTPVFMAVQAAEIDKRKAQQPARDSDPTPQPQVQLAQSPDSPSSVPQSVVLQSPAPQVLSVSLAKNTSALLSDLDEQNLTLPADDPQEKISVRKNTIKQLQSLAAPTVPLAKLFGLGVKTIVIDPGHGGKDPGATGHLGSVEKDIALDIAKRLRDRLDAYGQYHVLMTREADDFIPLNKRVEFANSHHADLFISIHINNFPSLETNFVETYYFGPSKNKKVADLAAYENADSKYLYGEFKEMVQKVGDTLKFQESKDLAEAVQQSLYKNIRVYNKKAKDHGIKTAPFVVLLGIDAPSILTEVTSLNNDQEEKRLNSPAYRDKIAKFLEKGIVTYLNKTITPGEEQHGAKKEKLAQAQDK
jgi:N-acetylmuramoyl-L-alanine amidase